MNNITPGSAELMSESCRCGAGYNICSLHYLPLVVKGAVIGIRCDVKIHYTAILFRDMSCSPWDREYRKTVCFSCICIDRTGIILSTYAEIIRVGAHVCVCGRPAESSLLLFSATAGAA